MSSDRVEEVAQNSPAAAWTQKVPERPGERNILPLKKIDPSLSAHLPDFALSDPGPKNGERTTKATIESGGEQRDLYLHLPANYDPKHPAPLILVFNGLGSGADGMEKFTGLSAAAEKDGYVVAYLDGAGPGHSWSNGHMPWGNHNDQQFADDTLKRLKKDLNIDNDRVFTVGYSQGGSGMNKLLSSLDGQVAAVAEDETFTDGKERPLQNPTSALIINGRDDLEVPYAGSAGMLADGWRRSTGVFQSEVKDIYNRDSTKLKGDEKEDITGTKEFFSSPLHWVGQHQEPVRHTVDYFKGADKISSPPQIVQNGSMTVETYSHGANGTEVEFITGAGRVHGWVGSSWDGQPIDPPMLDKNGKPVRDTDLIIDFFNHHPRQ
jgi:poly(3-hydroxybutyrate) depolymerase